MSGRTYVRPAALIVASLAVVFGAAVYTYQSLSTWKSYEANLNTTQARLTSLKRTALSADSTQKRLEAIRELDDSLAERNEFCLVHPLFHWQSAVIPVLRDGVKRCKDEVAKLDSLAQPLSELRQYLDVAAQVQAAVTQLKPQADMSATNWVQAGKASAERFKRDIAAIKATGDAAKLQQRARELADNLVEVWGALEKANESKDVAGFIATSGQLAMAYANLTGLADMADTAIQQKVAVLTDKASVL
jgi:DNA repair exonuclease SbcCD ATPase subunit